MMLLFTNQNNNPFGVVPEIISSATDVIDFNQHISTLKELINQAPINHLKPFINQPFNASYKMVMSLSIHNLSSPDW